MVDAASSWIPPTLGDCDGAAAPGWVLMDMCCYIADLPNATTAESTTSTGHPIQVTFRAARPPLLSHLCVHSPGLEFPRFAPKVITSDTNHRLLVVPLNPVNAFDNWGLDYFVYRAGAAHPPRLDLLPRPSYRIRFNDSEAAILSQGDGEYVVAALTIRVPRRERDPSSDEFVIKREFHLRLFHSSSSSSHDGEKQQHGSWVSKLLSLEDHSRDKLVPLPKKAYYRLYQETGKTIVIGGERGTIGWVDLWRGIIFCDVLDNDPVLHDMPLPLPARANWRCLLKHREPNYIRDVTVNHCRDTIKYVEMEIMEETKETSNACPQSYLEWFWQKPSNSSLIIRHGWKATTWTMPIPVASWDQWRRDCSIDVKDLTINVHDPKHLKLLSKLSGSDHSKKALRSVSMAYPIISMDDDSVYFFSVAKNMDKLEAVVAVDVRKKKLQGVAELDAQKEYMFMPTYIASDMSRYLTGTGVAAHEQTQGEALKPSEAHVKVVGSRRKKRRGKKKHQSTDG